LNRLITQFGCPIRCSQNDDENNHKYERKC
jgi:hypothetical protein